uniref:Uncharacterized protein n=1 Tax=viral metagenome TaxID=1070528 RepID=A0A6M3LTN3_9ZZZZ
MDIMEVVEMNKQFQEVINIYDLGLSAIKLYQTLYEVEPSCKHKIGRDYSRSMIAKFDKIFQCMEDIISDQVILKRQAYDTEARQLIWEQKNRKEIYK